MSEVKGEVETRIPGKTHPVRRLLPPISGLDVSPIPVMLILFTLNQWLAPFLGAY